MPPGLRSAAPQLAYSGKTQGPGGGGGDFMGAALLNSNPHRRAGQRCRGASSAAQPTRGNLGRRGGAAKNHPPTHRIDPSHPARAKRLGVDVVISGISDSPSATGGAGTSTMP